MSEIKEHVDNLIDTEEKVQLNIPYLKYMGKNGDEYIYENCIEKAIEFYGKPVYINSAVAYFEIESSKFYEYIDKGCPRCGKDKLRFLGWPVGKHMNDPEYMDFLVTYDLPGVFPNMGCKTCNLFIGVNKRWYSERDIFENHVKDKVLLNDGTEATITEVVDEYQYIVEMDYSDDSRKVRIGIEDIKHIIRRYD